MACCYDFANPKRFYRFFSAISHGNQCARDATPSTMKLWSPETLGFRGWDALDQAAIGQLDLMQRFVVISDQNGWNHAQEARITFKACTPHITACGRRYEPSGAFVGPCPPADLLRGHSRFTGPAASKTQMNTPPVTMRQDLVIERLAHPGHAPLLGCSLLGSMCMDCCETLACLGILENLG